MTCRRRRKFEQDGILAELIRNAGLTVPTTSAGSNNAANVTATEIVGNSGVDAGGAASGLAPIPDAVPVIPETFSPRETDSNLVLDVLLSRTDEATKQQHVLAHGMGGLGKV